MGIKMSDLEEGTQLILQVSNSQHKMAIDAFVKKILKNDMAVISLDVPTDKKLNFGNVKTDMEYYREGDMPIIWRNVKIVNYKSEYVVQILAEGGNHNRRECFRVGIHVPAQLRMMGHGMQTILIRDISLSGFSITDRKKELGLAKGMELNISFEDADHRIELLGRVVRIEEREDAIIYGMEICNLCKDLSSYISKKQRRKR